MIAPVAPPIQQSAICRQHKRAIAVNSLYYVKRHNTLSIDLLILFLKKQQIRLAYICIHSTLFFLLIYTNVPILFLDKKHTLGKFLKIFFALLFLIVFCLFDFIFTSYDVPVYHEIVGILGFSQQFLEFTGNGAKNKKHRVSSCSAGRNTLLMREVRG